MEPSEIRDVIGDLDPIRASALADFSAKPVVTELLATIVDEPLDARHDAMHTPRDASPAPTVRIDSARRRSRRNAAFVAVSAAAAVVVFAFVLAGLSSSPATNVGRPHPAAALGPLPTPGTTTPDVPRASGVWTLVSDLVGTTFHSEPSPANTPTLWLACPSSTTCYVVVPASGSASQSAIEVDDATDQVEITTDGGQTWRRSDLPEMLNSPTPIECVDTSTCALLGIDTSGHARFVETTDGGQTWSSTPGPAALASYPLANLSCATASSCMTVATAGLPPATTLAFETSDAGRTWSESPLPSGFTGMPFDTSVKCLTMQTCLVIGEVGIPTGQVPAQTVNRGKGEVLRTTDGGKTWKVVASAPGGIGNLLSCSAPSDCTAIFGAGPFATSGQPQSMVLTSTDGGLIWSQVVTTELPTGPMSTLSCQSSGQCWVSGSVGFMKQIGNSEAFIGTSSDAGRTWQQAHLPSQIEMVLTISCSSDSTCFALGLQADTGGEYSLAILSNR